jgi:hypothetical protein
MQDKKRIATIRWHPLVFHLLDALPKGKTFHAEHCGDNILTALIPLRLEVGENL